MTVEAELPDGTILEFPDGTDPNVIQATVKKQLGVAPETSTMDRVMGSKPGRALYGAVSPILGAAEFGAKASDAARQAIERKFPSIDRLIPDWTVGDKIGGFVDTLDAAKQRGMEEAGTKYDVAGLLGAMGTGGVATRGMQVAKSIPGLMKQGAQIGGAFGLATPVGNEGNYATQKALQAGIGAAAGGIVPPVLTAARRGLGPFMPGGGSRASGRLVNDILEAEGPTAKKELLEALATTGGDVRAAAGRANSPGISALLKRAESSSPKAAKQFVEMDKARDRAIVEELTGALGSKATVPGLVQARGAATEPFFTAAKSSTAKIDPNRTIGLIDRIMASKPNETTLQNVLGEVKRTMQKTVTERVPVNRTMKQIQAGEPSFKTVSTKAPQDTSIELMSASRNIRDLMAEKSNEGIVKNKAIMRELRLIKRSLDQQIGKAVPDAKKGNELFSALSRPVDQAKLGEVLKQSLNPRLNPLGAGKKLKSEAYAKALDDAHLTMKKASGFKRGDIWKTMTDEQASAVNRIADELVDVENYKDMATKGTSALNKLFQDKQGQESLPGVLVRWVVIFNNMVSKAGHAREGKAMDVLTEMSKSSRGFAKWINKIPPEDREFVTMLVRSSAMAGPRATEEFN